MSDIANKIKAAQDRPTKPIEIPEWDCTVHLRTLGGKERDLVETWTFEVEKGLAPNFRARFALLVLGHEDGSRIFKDDELPVLEEKNGRVLELIRDEGMKFNGYTEDEIKEMEKNSESGQSSDSGASSPSPSEDAPSKNSEAA